MAMATKARHRKAGVVDPWPQATGQNDAAFDAGQSLVQLDDEGAIILVLRLHQRHRLPGRRQDRDPFATGVAMSARNRRDCIETGR
jgi:hypothetical protein